MSTNRQATRKRKSSTAATPKPNVAAGATAVAATEQSALSASEAAAWESGYDYVFSDLRKLAIVSLSLFVVIIVAGFFL